MYTVYYWDAAVERWVAEQSFRDLSAAYRWAAQFEGRRLRTCVHRERAA